MQQMQTGSRVTFRVKASSDGESSLQFVAENLPAVQTQKTEAITAIAAYGTMPQRKTLKMHINLQLPEGEAGDVIKNSLTHGTLSAFASTYIVSRRLEGQTWLDDDMNGIRSQSEASLNGAGVVLMKLKENGDPQKLSDYEVYRYTGSDGLLHPAQVVTGQQINLTTRAISTYTEGHYSFNYLPKGTFGISFADRNYEVPGTWQNKCGTGANSLYEQHCPMWETMTGSIRTDFHAMHRKMILSMGQEI